jgi:mannose-1-phosphate guanylyltransferase
MIQSTFDRVLPLVSPDRIFVVTAREHVPLVQDHLPDIPPQNILGEPCGRNTAAAVAWAAREIERIEPTATMLVLAADHHILNPDTFRRAALRAAGVANQHRGLVLFGLEPEGPRTQYGYILSTPEPVDSDLPRAYPVRRFHEKPPEAVAIEYLSSGRCFWNSGMFCWRVDTVLEELVRHAPDVLTSIDEALTCDSNGFTDAYGKIPVISIDHALIERTDRAFVLDSGIQRIDLGSWTTVGALWPKDDTGNATIGDVALFDVRDSVLHSEDVLTAAVGVENLVVVVTEHAVLVCDRKRANEVGELVKTIQRAGKTERL